MADENTEVKEKAAETTSPQAKETEAEAKAKTEEAEKAKLAASSEESETEVEISEMEKLEDGRVQLKVGNSTYFGKDEQEVIQKALKGTADKDKSYDKVVAELNKLKAESSIRGPEEDEQLPEPPAPEDFITKIFTARGLDPKFASFTDADWEEHNKPDEDGHRKMSDFALNRLVERVEAAANDARNQYVASETVWLNRSMLRKEITPAVQAIVAESGLDPETFGKEYLEVLQSEGAKYKDGQLNQSFILTAMTKKIVAALKKSDPSASEVQKRKEAADKELEEKKKNLAGAGPGPKKAPSTTEAEPKTIAEAFQRFDKRIKSGRA